MIRRTLAAVIAALLVAACTHPTQFERYISRQQWTDAAREFAADSSLRYNPRTLYLGGVLFGTPKIATYDPLKSRDLFSSLLTRWPNTEFGVDAKGRMLLIDEVLHAQRSAADRQQELESQVAQLTKDYRALRARIDSGAFQTDSLRSALGRVEADRREKDEQLKALRLELQRLKEIDLKPRSSRPPA
jgi:outer membrane murein-binding lipoprotein Lpp